MLMSPSMSPSDRTTFLGRKCSLISEESIEEDDEDMDQVAVSRSRNLASRSNEGYTSDDSDSRSNTDLNDSPVRSVPPARQRKVRPLHSVRSSPQLLNQIFEEGESEDEELLSSTSHRSPRLFQRNSVASPEVLRKYETTRKKRLSQGTRGASCSSSDASDTDDPDSRKRKEKFKQKLYRRDSSDHSSDTDNQSGPSGPGGSRGQFPGGASGHDRHDDQHNKDNDRDKNSGKKKSEKRERRHSGGGKQNGLLPLSKRDSNGSDGTHTDICRKISNMSLASNLSNLSLTSLTSRSSKYVVGDSSANTPKRTGSTKSEIDAMNEENKARTQVIHVRSKEFTDLVDRFNAGKDETHTVSTLKEPGVKFRRRPKDKIKTDINRNGLIACADGELLEMDVKKQETNVVKTKCCSLV